MTNAEKEKEKALLLAEAKNYQTQLIKQVEDTTDVVKAEGQKVVFLLVGVLVAFSVVQLLVVLLRTPSPPPRALSNENHAEPAYSPTATYESPIARLIKKAIMEFLLALAKKILQEALEKYKKKEG